MGTMFLQNLRIQGKELQRIRSFLLLLAMLLRRSIEDRDADAPNAENLRIL